MPYYHSIGCSLYLHIHCISTQVNLDFNICIYTCLLLTLCPSLVEIMIITFSGSLNSEYSFQNRCWWHAYIMQLSDWPCLLYEAIDALSARVDLDPAISVCTRTSCY